MVLDFWGIPTTNKLANSLALGMHGKWILSISAFQVNNAGCG